MIFDQKEESVVNTIGIKNLLSNIVDGDFIQDTVMKEWERHENI